MSKRVRARSILRKEAVLLRHSTVLDNHEWLKQLLQDREGLTASEYVELSQVVRSLLDQMYDAILKQAAAEWRALEHKVRDLENRTGNCTLCNQKIRYECFIKNLHTGEEMVVGSECVKKFGIEMDSKKTLAEVLKNASRLQRREKLALRFPGMHDFLQEAENFPNSLEILVPADVEAPFLTTARELRALYDKYIDGGIKRSEESIAIEQIGMLWQSLLKEQEKLMDFVKQNKEDRLRPTRSVIQYLRNHATSESMQALKWLKEDGVVTRRTLFRITEPRFLRSLVPLWEQALSRVGIQLVNFDEQQLIYLYRFEHKPTITLAISHQKLALVNYGELIFRHIPREEFEVSNLLQNSYVYDRDGSLDRVVEAILRHIRSIRYRVYERDDGAQRVVVIDSNGMYVHLGIPDLVKTCLPGILGFEEPEAAIRRYLASPRHKRFTRQQQEAFEEAIKGFGRAPTA